MAFTSLLSATRTLALVAIYIPVTAQQERPAVIPVDLVVPFAPCPVPAEGHRHLVYELHVANYTRCLMGPRIGTLLAVDGRTQIAQRFAVDWTNVSLTRRF